MQPGLRNGRKRECHSYRRQLYESASRCVQPEEGLGTSCNNDNALTCVTFPEELHAHDGENEDNDTEDEGEVTESTNSFPHDGDEKVECWPRLCKFEHS